MIRHEALEIEIHWKLISLNKSIPPDPTTQKYSVEIVLIQMKIKNYYHSFMNEKRIHL